MFGQKIVNTPFTSGSAHSYFKDTIYERNTGADARFISTLRALLHQRIGDNKIKVQYSSSKFSQREAEATTVSSLVSYMLSEDPCGYSDKIYIHGINGESPDRNANLKRVRERFARSFNGFERVQKVTDFFRKSFPVVCFVNQQKRTTVIFIDKITLRKFHAIQSAVFAFLPWYFNPDEGVTQDELDLIQSLQEKSPDKYNEVINRMFGAIDIRAAIIRRGLKGFEASYDRITIENLESEIANDNGYIERYLRDIATRSKSVRDKMFRVSTLKERISGTKDELMEYFIHNKNLDLVSVNDSSVTFMVKGQLLYFDEENAKRCINNGRSFIYSYNAGADISNEDYKALMTAIFVDQTLHINVIGEFKLSLEDGVSAIAHFSIDNNTYANYTPNPHLYHFHCLGGNEKIIAEIIRSGNTIGAVEQCCASNSSLNFSDSTVMGRFMYTLCGGNGINVNCIELPTGEVTTPKGAIEWLKKQGTEETASE